MRGLLFHYCEFQGPDLERNPESGRDWLTLTRATTLRSPNGCAHGQQTQATFSAPRRTFRLLCRPFRLALNNKDRPRGCCTSYILGLCRCVFV